MNNEKGLYEILEVHHRARQEVIQAAYRRLSLIYHPDQNKSPDAEERMKELNEAYAILTDPAKRSAYDAGRTRSGTGEDARQRAQEAEAKRKARKENATRRAEEAKAKRKAREEDSRRRTQGAEAKRKAREEDSKRKAQEKDSRRRTTDEEYYRKLYEDAITDFNKAISLDPNLAVAYNNRGVAYQRLGETIKANQDFAKAKELGYEN